MEVHLEPEIDIPGFRSEPWANRLKTAMTELGLPADTELAVRLVSDASIRTLNRDHRGKDAATDVLSFPMYEADELAALLAGDQPRDPGPLLLGDLVVSWETCNRQAEHYGHGLEREFGFLLAHGLLHLVGDDHQTPEDEGAMRERQRILLDLWDLGLESA